METTTKQKQHKTFCVKKNVPQLPLHAGWTKGPDPSELPIPLKLKSNLSKHKDGLRNKSDSGKPEKSTGNIH